MKISTSKNSQRKRLLSRRLNNSSFFIILLSITCILKAGTVAFLQSQFLPCSSTLPFNIFVGLIFNLKHELAYSLNLQLTGCIMLHLQTNIIQQMGFLQHNLPIQELFLLLMSQLLFQIRRLLLYIRRLQHKLFRLFLPPELPQVFLQDRAFR